MNFTVPKDIDMTQQASWCPGCGHGIVCRIITEAVQELGVSNKVLTVDDVACGQFGQFAMKYNTVMSAHGRTIATAAGMLLLQLDNFFQLVHRIQSFQKYF